MGKWSRFLLGWIGLVLFAQPGSLVAQYGPPNSPDIRFDWSGIGQGRDYLLTAPIREFSPSPRKSTNFLFDAEGKLAWFSQHNTFIYDFKVQPSGMLSYFQQGYWHLLDSGFVEVDSFRCQGYPTDVHDFLHFPDGRALLLCVESTYADVSMLNTTNGTPGSTNARVDICVVQEMDENKIVLQEWHGANHFSIFDTDTSYFNNPNLLDLSHSNSIDLDSNGNLLISHRHLNALTMVDWNTGNLQWQFSGLNNQFDLQGDEGTFAQHDARILGPNKFSVYDNGTNHHASRGLVFELDTVNWRATKTLEIRDPAVFSDGMGSFRHFPDGSNLICHGYSNPSSQAETIFLDADSNTVFELYVQDTYNSYRSQIQALPFDLVGPQVICTETPGGLELSLADSYDSYLWTTDATSPAITLIDTGYYHVYVPMGIGMVASNTVHVLSLQGCGSVLEASPSNPEPLPMRKLMGRFDLLGRPCPAANGKLIIERYENGQARKVWQQD